MAIQVNGTTVIDNSRNLTNIASVDATTAAAIGNAGVGGTLVDLGFTSLTSTNFTSLDISMPSGYHRVYIEMFNIACATANQVASIITRFKDGSGTLYSSPRDYRYETSSSYSASEYLICTTPAYDLTDQYGDYGFVNYNLMVSNFASSTQRTNFDHFGIGAFSYSNGSPYSITDRACGTTRTAYTVATVNLYSYYGMRATGNSGYQMYGWKA